ncbi:hypothetical protein ABIE62_000448 [Porphyrobacter sp. MBR-155]|jgi:hypothetical protein|uniref:DUF1203 domain-containing protein n=1 Tax=Porphyrobacter sp. MBR-155 TaxID=3156464 RepID=UPI003392AC95
MVEYEIKGLDWREFAPLYGLDDEELVRRGVVRMVVDAQPGYPCRVTLEDAVAGETVLLLNHTSRADSGPYRTSHAIFVREGTKAVARYINAVPPVFLPRVLSLRGFDADGMMVDAILAQSGEADAGLRHLFAQPTIVEIDAHNAVRGCFAGRVRRKCFT